LDLRVSENSSITSEKAGVSRVKPEKPYAAKYGNKSPPAIQNGLRIRVHQPSKATCNDNCAAKPTNGAKTRFKLLTLFPMLRWKPSSFRCYVGNDTRPCWPSAKMRYCTADLKREPINRWLRNTFPTGNVICAMGLRAQESHTRAKRQSFTLRTSSSAPTKGRFVYDWLPIHDWTATDVWECIRQHGDIAHPAYHLDHPNQRLSCALCILANMTDLLNGAVHNPNIYREYCRIEAVTGYSFRKDFWLSDLKPELLPESTLIAVRDYKRSKT